LANRDGGGRTQRLADPKANQARIAEEHVPGAVGVAISDVGAGGTPEGLASSGLVIDCATSTTGLRSVGLVDDEDAAPGSLSHGVQHPLLEAIVTPE